MWFIHHGGGNVSTVWLVIQEVLERLRERKAELKQQLEELHAELEESRRAHR